MTKADMDFNRGLDKMVDERSMLLILFKFSAEIVTLFQSSTSEDAFLTLFSLSNIPG